MFDFLRIKTDAQKIGGLIRELHAKREGMVARRAELQRLPLAKSDLIAGIESYIDLEASRYPSQLGPHLKYLAESKGAVGGYDAFGHIDLLSCVGHVGVSGSPAHIQKSLMFYFPTQIKEGIRKAINAIPEYDAGPPMAERADEIARLDIAIPKIERELAELVRAANDAGLSIDGGVSDFSKGGEANRRRANGKTG